MEGKTHMLPPEKRPADPRPEKARPMMKTVEVCADAQMTEPMPRMVKETRKIVFMG